MRPSKIIGVPLLSNKVIVALLSGVIQNSMRTLDIPYDSGRMTEEHPLIHFLQEELSKMLALAGGARCAQLEAELGRLLSEDPERVEAIVQELIKKYCQAKILRGPPDRFEKEREKAKEIWG